MTRISGGCALASLLALGCVEGVERDKPEDRIAFEVVTGEYFEYLEEIPIATNITGAGEGITLVAEPPEDVEVAWVDDVGLSFEGMLTEPGRYPFEVRIFSVVDGPEGQEWSWAVRITAAP